MKIVVLVLVMLFSVVQVGYSAFVLYPGDVPAATNWVLRNDNEIFRTVNRNVVTKNLLTGAANLREDIIAVTREAVTRGDLPAGNLSVRVSITSSLDANMSLASGFNLSTFTSSRQSSIINIVVNNVLYEIFVPRGTIVTGHVMVDGVQREVTKEINTEMITSLINALNELRSVFMRSLLEFSMQKSYAVYTAYSKEQLVVGGGEGGGVLVRQDGRLVFGGEHSNKIMYSLKYVFNPFLGRIVEVPVDDAAWEVKLANLVLSVSSGETAVGVDTEYSNFVMDMRVPTSRLGGITNRVGNIGLVLTAYRGRELQHVVDYRMRVATPSVFKRNDAGIFVLDGLKLLDSVRITLNTGSVENKAGETYERLGSIVDFNIVGDSMMLYHKEVEGKIIGVVIPLLYSESVVDTTRTANVGDILLTGRSVVFGASYASNMRLLVPNSYVLGVSTPIGGVSAADVRAFVFTVGADVHSRESHVSLESGVNLLQFNFDFVQSENVGFVVYKNNVYANNEELIHWLRTDHARGTPNVNVERLIEVLTGVLDLEQRGLTFEEYLRVLQIREGLDMRQMASIASNIRVVSIVLGILLIFYSMLLIPFYYFDVFNNVVDLSLISMLTFKRVYPVCTKEELEYLKCTKGDLRYVTFGGVLWMAGLGVAVGVLLLMSEPILMLFFRLYILIAP